MAEFVCKLGTDAGRVMTQTEEARSEEELRQRLKSQGFMVFSIESKELLRFSSGPPKPGKISPDDFLIFNQQFLTLSKSGLPLQKSLDLLAHQTRSDTLRLAIESVRDKVRSGALLSEAFESTGNFPKIYCATVRAGERSGNLDKVLAQYVGYQKQARGFRKKFISALIYPAILVVVLTLLVTLVIEYIVPQFSKLYADMDVQLPAITTFTISFAMQLKHYFLLLVAGLVGLVFLFRAMAQSEQTSLAWERAKFKLPFVGSLLQKFSVAEFARTLAVLLQGGTPIIIALDTVKDSVSSPWLGQAISDARSEVAAGKELSACLRTSGFFPSIAIDMMEVGETTGAMSNMLEALAEFFEEDVNIDLETRLALVGPVMIAIIAIIVAFVLIAFYMPLFSMASMVH
jgi:type IV pilus assembly protein PilC